MNQVGPGKVAQAKNLYFRTSGDPRGSKVDIASMGGNYVIDIDGAIYEVSAASGESAAITIVGGIDTFVNEKQYRPYSFYISQRQKLSLYEILRELSKVTIKAQLSAGDNEVLDYLISNTYSNYCG